MELFVLADPDAVALEAVERLALFLAGTPAPRVGFPTGKTPLPFYAQLAARRGAGLATSGIRPFGLDEYRGVPQSHPGSFAAFLRRHVVEPLDIPSGAALLLDGAAADAAGECARHDRALAAGGGIDLAILGLGANGHVAFNEPGSARDSRTRVLALAPSSIAAARADLPDLAAPPTEALSVGIATLLEARALWLLVTGAGKADILRRALEGPETPEVPASLMRAHPQLTVLADRAAASALGRQ